MIAPVSGLVGLSQAGIDAVPHVDWGLLSPVLGPSVAILLVLLLDAAGPQRRSLRRVHDAIALLGLLSSVAAVLSLAARGAEGSTMCVPSSGLQLPACSFSVSTLTLTLQGVILAGAVICLLLAVDGDGAADRPPHHVLFLAAVVGALVLPGARDLITLVVALETASLPAVGLVGLRRDAPGAQGAMTLLFTAIGSLGLLLLGTALLLLATGSLHLERISGTLSDPSLPTPVRAVAVLGALLAASGVAFKLSAVPFHLWTPDTYAGAPLPVAAFLAVVSKAAGLSALVVLLALGLPALGGIWAPVIGVVAAVTVTVGNLVALRQRVAVRLLAWSTVAQAGWVLLPLAAASGGTPTAIRSAVAASVGYLAAYIAASLAAFSVVVVLGRHHPAAEEHSLDAYRGLVRREPVASVVLAFALACLAGLPPGVMGLVAKVIVVRPLVDVSAWTLAGVAAVNVILGLVYYLRWAALLFTPARGEAITWRVRVAEGLALGASGAACVALSVWPQAIAGLLPTVLR
ncbi:MAG TPA: proton-conducting transporter membrane subunit [Kineosporiaceae bacterium]|nr:proton-conducting transporter membrane subunit [Kineosporiaceae bacterium]